MAVPLADHQSLGYSLGKALLGVRVLSLGAGDKDSGDISWSQLNWLGGSACSPWAIEMLPAWKLVMIKTSLEGFPCWAKKRTCLGT